MTDTTRNILTQAGVDLVSANMRMMGNEKLLLRLLFKIDNEKNYARLAEAFRGKDVEEAIDVSHTLKGQYGGVSVMPLYDLFTRMTALLRAGDVSAARAMLPEAKEKMDALQEALTQAKQAEENA